MARGVTESITWDAVDFRDCAFFGAIFTLLGPLWPPFPSATFPTIVFGNFFCQRNSTLNFHYCHRLSRMSKGWPGAIGFGLGHWSDERKRICPTLWQEFSFNAQRIKGILSKRIVFRKVFHKGMFFYFSKAVPSLSSVFNWVVILSIAKAYDVHQEIPSWNHP